MCSWWCFCCVLAWFGMVLAWISLPPRAWRSTGPVLVHQTRLGAPGWFWCTRPVLGTLPWFQSGPLFFCCFAVSLVYACMVWRVAGMVFLSPNRLGAPPIQFWCTGAGAPGQSWCTRQIFVHWASFGDSRGSNPFPRVPCGLFFLGVL